MKPHGYPRRLRLSGRPDIRAVFQQGQYHRLGVLHAKALASGRAQSRFLISVRRAVGSAPERNRIKRLVRECLRLYPLSLPSAHDVCLFLSARPAQPVDLARFRAELQALAKRLSGRRSPGSTPSDGNLPGSSLPSKV